MALSTAEHAVRSLDSRWCYERWKRLRNHGNRDRVIAWVLTMITAPSTCHLPGISAAVNERFAGAPATIL